MSRSSEASQRRKRALADAVAGVAGSLVSLWAFYPIEVWKTNLQAGSSLATVNMRRSLFQGCRTKTLHTASSNFCYFFLYSWIFAQWKRRNGQNSKPNAATRLMLSAVAAMLNTMITLPLDVISSKEVTLKDDNRPDGNEDVNDDDDHPVAKDSLEFHDCSTFQEEKKDESFLQEEESSLDESTRKDESLLEVSEATQGGWSSLWKGLAPALLLCSNPSINYTVFDVAKNQMLAKGRRSSSSLSMPEAFVLGLFAKFVATIATYPLIRAKVILMVTSEKSLIGSLIRSYNQDGVRGLYKGCDWQLLHTVLKSALMMMVREQITASTHQLIVGNVTGAQ